MNLQVIKNQLVEKYFKNSHYKNVKEAELGAVAKEGMPNIPGMDLFK
ncbi:hypothetical protein LZZ90_08205 [Flavobacterium sp. SM15]|nr:hypothetical protein [Flavobacterium sp. SM15]MCG2611488.1 hypothetical protein [Flavobacterium sp. SM15]